MNKTSEKKECRADLLSAYLDGELDDSARKTLENHLENCKVCRERLETLGWLVGLLSDLPSAPMPPDYMKRLSRRMEQAFSPSRVTLFRWYRLLPVGALAAAVIMSFLVYQPFSPRVDVLKRPLRVADTVDALPDIALFPPRPSRPSRPARYRLVDGHIVSSVDGVGRDDHSPKQLVPLQDNGASRNIPGKGGPQTASTLSASVHRGKGRGRDEARQPTPVGNGPVLAGGAYIRSLFDKSVDIPACPIGPGESADGDIKLSSRILLEVHDECAFLRDFKTLVSDGTGYSLIRVAFTRCGEIEIFLQYASSEGEIHSRFLALRDRLDRLATVSGLLSILEEDGSFEKGIVKISVRPVAE